MWNHAEVVALLDGQGIVKAVSRNEEEAPIRNVVGSKLAGDRILKGCREATFEAFEAALQGEEVQLEIGAIADDGHIFWSRARMTPSPEPDIPVLLHLRRLPNSWNALSTREKEVINTLHEAQMNPKRAAKHLGITLNTFNAHRRTISQKCNLRGIGEFWVFVERCR